MQLLSLETYSIVCSLIRQDICSECHKISFVFVVALASLCETNSLPVKQLVIAGGFVCYALL
jgi:hypothetical protein